MSVVALVNTQIEQATFEDFWLMYPKRVARKEALKAWDRLTDADKVAALTALVDWRREWMKKDLQYVPHASSWLNGERWTDELPSPAVATASHASHVVVTASGSGSHQNSRAAIPDNVKAVLAKLRAK